MNNFVFHIQNDIHLDYDHDYGGDDDDYHNLHDNVLLHLLLYIFRNFFFYQQT